MKVKKKEKRPLNITEKNVLNSVELNVKQKIFIDVMRYAGLRRGEALALTKKDIDFEKNSININKSLYFVGNVPNIKDTKTVSSKRVVPMPKIFADELRGYIESISNDKLFPMNNGNYMTKSSFLKFWSRILKTLSSASKEDIYFTPHVCRHTYATDLYYSGVDIKMAQYLLGHSSLNVTMDIYTHLDKSKTQDAVKKLNDYLSGDVKC